MSPEISVNHQQHPDDQDQHSTQKASPLQEIAPAPPVEGTDLARHNTTTTQPTQGVGITSAITTATAAQAAAAAAAAGRDMKNFSDMEINELLGLIPDEYTAEQEAEEAAATAAANAASALGKGVHHNVTVTTPSLVPSNIRRVTSNNAGGQQQSNGINSSTNGAPGVDGKSQDAHIAAQEAQLRSERKRSREKQRRNDVNKQFVELTEVLKNIERDAQEMGRNDDAYGSVSTMMAIAASTGPTNRVDLIARTIVHLERLNRTAKKQQTEIANLQERLERTKKAGEDMAEKLKDVMFSQQRQFAAPAFSPYPNMTASSVTVAAGTPAASAPGMTSMSATNGVGIPHAPPSQQHMPMMMMPVMMPPTTAQTQSPAGAPTGAPSPATMQQQPQQQFMMMMPHPGSQMAMAGQPMQQVMQPVVAVQQQHQSVQQPVAQQQIYVQQQQQQPIAPAPQQAKRGQGGTSAGENLAHAA